MSQLNEHKASPRPADVADKAIPLEAPMNDEPLSVRHTMAVAFRPEMHLACRSNRALAAEPDSHVKSNDTNLKADREAIEAWANEGDPN